MKKLALGLFSFVALLAFGTVTVPRASAADPAEKYICVAYCTVIDAGTSKPVGAEKLITRTGRTRSNAFLMVTAVCEDFAVNEGSATYRMEIKTPIAVQYDEWVGHSSRTGDRYKRATRIDQARSEATAINACVTNN